MRYLGPPSSIFTVLYNCIFVKHIYIYKVMYISQTFKVCNFILNQYRPAFHVQGENPVYTSIDLH